MLTPPGGGGVSKDIRNGPERTRNLRNGSEGPKLAGLGGETRVGKKPPPPGVVLGAAQRRNF